MDCSLSTWPSITQFDDFSWAGLGDIDPLESLDQNLANDPTASFPSLQEAKPSLPENTIPCSDTSSQIPHTQSSDLYRLRSSDSLAAARWESINAMDLESVLDSTFPSNEGPSTPSAKDVYDLYSDGILNDVDTFMSDSMSGIAEGNTTFLQNGNISMNANLPTSAVVSLSSSQEDGKCESGAIDGDSSSSINISQMGLSHPVAIRGDNIDNGGGMRVDMSQPFPYNSRRPPACGDPCASSQCASDLKESMLPRRHGLFQPNLMMQWPKAQSTSANLHVFEREKVVHYPVIMDQQTRLTEVEMKRNRAQARRARRLAASQRRAKKYPLQKLIRMSSSPASTRDKLEQNMAGSAAMLHPQLHMVSQSHFPGVVQPLPRSTLTSQVPSFLPVVLQSSHLASNQEVLSQANHMQGGPYFCYQQTSATPVEDNRISSGSGVMQSMCTDQDVQSLSSTPNLPVSHSTNSAQFLDAALLEELQSILGKMDVNVRLCIRDALYRLANSAKHRQSSTDTSSVSSSSHSKDAMETNTNAIDRWIVNILFCKQPTSFEANLQSHTNQSMENISMIGSSQQWNSCGSTVNLQKQRQRVVTGL